MNWRRRSSAFSALHGNILPSRGGMQTGDVAMPQVASLVWLAAGAALFGVVARVAIPPLTWLALTFLVHASRSMPAVSGTAFVWLALFIAVAIGDRGILPISGPGYFAVVAVTAMTLAAPFGLDRVAVARPPGLRPTLVFPMAFVAAEFLRSRFAPGATWGAIAYTQYGYLALMQVAAVVGIWGLTFLPAWFAATFELAWSRGFASSSVQMPVLTCAAAIGAP